MAAGIAICQVLAGAERGGLERHCADLCNALAERHTVTVIAHPVHAAAFAGRVRFVPLDLAAWRYHPARLWQLLGVLLRIKPDVVHSHASKATAMVALLRPRFSARFVATLHNAKSNAGMFRGCDAVIAVSRALCQTLPARRTWVIRNGIAAPAPVDQSDVAALREPLQGRALALAVGRLVEAKGFDLLLAAWRQLPAQLWIAGDGPQRGSLERTIDRYALRDRVRLLGHRDDVALLMRAANLLVLPSRREGFPYVLVEALHHRLAVVATRVPGAVDVLPEQWLVPAGDSTALRGICARALGDAPRLRADFAEPWARAAVELNLSAMVERTESVYRQVLDG